jgi:hypothetical protein
MAKKKYHREQRLLEETESLFQFVPPRQLKKSLYEVYAFYLQHIDTTIMHPGFNRMAEDFYFLYNFLERMEEMEEE